MPLPSEMKPTVPRNFVATPGRENVTLMWDVPAFSNASAVSGYMIYYGTSPGSMSIQIACNQRVYVLEGLTKGQTYYFKVAAQNSAGWGSNSTVISGTPFGVPDAPRGLEAVPGNSQVMLNWTASSYTGPGTITYRLFRDQVMVWSGTATSHTDSGLINGHEYSYQVSAGNSVGWGLNTTSIHATPIAPSVPPGVPIGLHIVEGDDRLTLNWTAPSHSGSSPITHYKLYRGTVSGSLTFLINVTGTSYTDLNIIKGQKYYYKVSAVSAAGESSLSAEVNGETENENPAPGIAIEFWLLGVVALAVAIVAVLVAALFVPRWRKGKKAAAPPPYPPIQGNATGPTGNNQGQVPHGMPSQLPPSQSQDHQPQPPGQPIQYCPGCGSQTTGFQFCGTCGRQLK